MATFPVLVYVGFNVLSASGHYNKVECGSSGSVTHAHTEEERVPRKGTVLFILGIKNYEFQVSSVTCNQHCNRRKYFNVI